MQYTSLAFYMFLLAAVVLYYIVPVKYRWYVLLAGSVFFYASLISRKLDGILFLATILISWLTGILLEKENGNRRIILIAGLGLSVLPLLLVKLSGFMPGGFSLIVPAGLSFYTLQIVSYLVDICRKDTQAEHNFLKYALFISFFPQIIQGPIPRHSQLAPQLYEGHRFSEKHFFGGLQLILYGFFLKLMIADKAGIFASQVFDHSAQYSGTYLWLAAILYSFQLYSDFFSCVTICQGVSALFGIRLAENFDHPYTALSIQEFWRRWHISLSSWLRDYIYIPLGGSRKGELRRYINLLVTFLVSGIWHGSGLNYIAWGLLHGVYQITGRLSSGLRRNMYAAAGLAENTLAYRTIRRLGTFFWVMLGWIVFRAPGLRAALSFIRRLWVWNPWTLFDGSVCRLGLDARDWLVLLVSLFIMGVISTAQMKGSVREWYARQNIAVRWVLCFGMIFMIWIFGTYGYGFAAGDFIYGGF